MVQVPPSADINLHNVIGPITTQKIRGFCGEFSGYAVHCPRVKYRCRITETIADVEVSRLIRSGYLGRLIRLG